MALLQCRLPLLGAIARTLPIGSRTFAGLCVRLMGASGYRVHKTFHGFLMNADLSMDYQREICLGLYEQALTQKLRSLLAFGGLFLDVGANIGFFTLLAAKRLGPQGRVLSFEADPNNLLSLRANLALNEVTNTVVMPMAAGNRVGKARFVTGEHSVGSSLENEAGTIQHLDARYIGTHKHVVEVEMTTLDTACLETVSGWHGLTILKMDIEGAEPLALRGARNVLTHIDAAFVESNPFMLQQHGFTPADIIATMADAGLEGFAIPERRSITRIETGFNQAGNLLFLREGTQMSKGFR